ncbi:adenosylcobinamide-phosphate synthase CbiB [Fusobacterium sp. MFO224]|uniref:adenosylcobinamide-phosphate synthase CbiB n=1 Tax=Fusobacterium sp. MFO224 TaxID=3378070 RepID=UPI0038539942
MFSLKFFVAYILDLIFGDPENFPHPVRIIGKLISFLEKKLYRYDKKILFGGIAALITIISTFLISYLVAYLSDILEIILLYTTLATKCLAGEGIRVYKILQKGDLKEAKEKLSYLVSRDTETMEKKDIVRSVLETISENSIDGVIAPMFYAFLGSYFSFVGISLALPFAMTYKSINTLDSMLGYKNEKYLKFGKISARIDDLANIIPARLGGMIFIPLASALIGYNYKNSLKIFFRDRKNHASPNSGHGESAFAGALGVQFGGKTKYFGIWYNKPTIGDKIKEFEISDILKGEKLLYMTSFVTFLIFFIISLI